MCCIYIRLAIGIIVLLYFQAFLFLEVALPTINVTVFWKTDLMITNTEIHFLPVDECHTHALSRDHALETRWPGLLLLTAFLRHYKTTRVHSMACVAPEGH